jgi:hypothetical protein
VGRTCSYTSSANAASADTAGRLNGGKSCHSNIFTIHNIIAQKAACETTKNGQQKDLAWGFQDSQRDS